MGLLTTVKKAFTGQLIKEAAEKQGGKLKAEPISIGGISTGITAGLKLAKTVGILSGIGLVSYGLLKEDPKAPLKLVKGGVSIGEVIGGISKEPTLEKVKETVKEHPVISLTTAGLVVTGAGYSLGKFLPSLFTASALRGQTKAIKEQTEAMGMSYLPTTPTLPTEITPTLPKEVTTTAPTLPTEKTMPTDVSMAGTPETAVITTGTRKRRRKAVLQPQGQKISQRVNVIVSQKQATHRVANYLKEKQLVYA